MDTSQFFALLASSIASFFAICNPIANTPIFISMTEGDDAATKKKVARRSVMFAFAIVVVTALLGKMIGELFGITLPALKLAAGIIVFMIGYRMLSGEPHRAQKASDSDIKNSLQRELGKAVSPLAIPILAGGGTISTAAVVASDDGIEGILACIIGFGIIAIVTYFCFASGDSIERRLGQSGMSAVTRIMGLILATMGVQIFLGGLSDILNAYLPTIPTLFKSGSSGS
jgi:multiple antibiotic resistance protein